MINNIIISIIVEERLEEYVTKDTLSVTYDIS